MIDFHEVKIFFGHLFVYSNNFNIVSYSYSRRNCAPTKENLVSVYCWNICINLEENRC